MELVWDWRFFRNFIFWKQHCSTQSDSEAEVLEADFEAAMQDDNIKLSEAGIESMNLISTNDDNIDAEYAAEINGGNQSQF